MSARIINNNDLINQLDSNILWNDLRNKEDPDLQIETAKK